MATIFAQTTDQGDEGDLVSGIGSEIEVGFDRWSAGQIGLSDIVAAVAVVVVTNDGRTVYVPNRDVLDQVLINHSSIGRRRSELSLLLAEDVDLTEAAEGLRQAQAAELTLADPEVIVRPPEPADRTGEAG